ncbi:MAG: hypothetical protein B6U72_03015 [Candidatus Altiarchaeales archaeon ex4484_2]|nr:MAG: hypothetical protein B6U72_03015 [Candidatus Altiarchaeales archaeon ex4484_2]
MKKGEHIPEEMEAAMGITATSEFMKVDGLSLRVFQDKNGDKYVPEGKGYREIILGSGDVTVIPPDEDRDPEYVRSSDEHIAQEKKKTSKKASSRNKVGGEKKGGGLAESAPRPASLEQADLVEAQDIANNSDLVLQYEAPFKNRKTGQTEMRRWLGTNAWKLGLIEGYVKQGYSLSIEYKDTEELRTCFIELERDGQLIHAEGSYTKNRLKNFLSPAKDECFDTFAFRNAIKRIVSLKDVVRAVKETQEELTSIDVMPTKAIEG